NVSLPSGPSKIYWLFALTHGSSRRCRLTSSRSRVSSFSRVSKSLRAISHSSSDTTLEAFTSLVSVLGSIVSIFILSFSSFVCLRISAGFKKKFSCGKPREPASRARADGHQSQVSNTYRTHDSPPLGFPKTIRLIISVVQRTTNALADIFPTILQTI